MRNGATLLGTQVVNSGGVDGLGYVCQLDIADNGDLACRTDTETGYLRSSAGSTWIQAFRFGDNIAEADLVPKNFVATQVYAIAQAPSNSSIIFAHAYGYMFKSTDRAASWTRLTGFKSGAFDETVRWVGTNGGGAGAKLGHKHIAIDPIDPNIIYFGHPKDGLYVSQDGGTTWSGPKSGTVPTWSNGDQQGVDVVIDRTTSDGFKCLTIVLQVYGVGIVRTLTGPSGTWATLAGGPTASSGLEAKGGRIWACGDGNGNASQLKMYNGTSWSNPSGVLANQVSARSTTNHVIAMSIGGDMFHSTDSGDAWAAYANITFETDGAEVPVMSVISQDYMALGGMRYHPTLNRICATTGVGYFEFDSPPRTVNTQLWLDKSLGIKQLLIMGLKVTATKLFAVAQDRSIIVIDKATPSKQIANHGPDYNVVIRHGGGIDTAATDDNYVAATLFQDPVKGLVISSNGGQSWSNSPTWPIRAGVSGVSQELVGGSVAIGTVGNILWAPTNKNRMVGTLDGGINWFDPVFRDASNNVLDLSDSDWSPAYFCRRTSVVNEKHLPDNFICYSYGRGDGTNAATKAGIFKSTDKGQNWVQTYVGRIPYQNYVASHIRAVPGQTGHIFFANGQVEIHLDANAPDGLYFSSAYGASLFTMTGFQEVCDVGFGKAKYGASYPTIYVDGWRQVAAVWTHGIWVCTDFNPASPGASTWTKRYDYVNGRKGPVLLTGDMARYGDLYAAPFSGGHFVDKYTYNLRAT